MLLLPIVCSDVIFHLTSTLHSSAQGNVELHPKNSARALFRPHQQHHMLLMGMHSIKRLSTDSTKVACFCNGAAINSLCFEVANGADSNYGALYNASAHGMLHSMYQFERRALKSAAHATKRTVMAADSHNPQTRFYHGGMLLLPHRTISR